MLVVCHFITMEERVDNWSELQEHSTLLLRKVLSKIIDRVDRISVTIHPFDLAQPMILACGSPKFLTRVNASCPRKQLYALQMRRTHIHDSELPNS